MSTQRHQQFWPMEKPRRGRTRLALVGLVLVAMAVSTAVIQADRNLSGAIAMAVIETILPRVDSGR